MRENKHTAYDLAQMQSLPLEAKIRMTQRRIEEWYNYWDGNVYVSFSGGKDSTVLLHLVRELYPDVPAVFVDTGLEYPEIKAFVKTFDNVTVLRPEMSFRQVIEKYGYPVISKKVARYLRDVKRNNAGAKNDNVTRLRLTGFNSDGVYSPSMKLPNKWQYLIESSFSISEQCCDVMKKKPLKAFAKATNRRPIVGTMADESEMRARMWRRHGCNLYDSKDAISAPLSFWTEQDVLRYIKEHNIPIASVYGDIVEANGKLRTTGEHRTGCVFCMFGAHLEKSPNRFERLKKTHPQLWDYCMKPWSDGGLGLKEVCEFCGIKTGGEEK